MEIDKDTKITLLEAKIAVLESVIKEYLVKDSTNNIKENFMKLLNGVQKEYPNHALDNNFNLVEKTIDKEEKEIYDKDLYTQDPG